MTTETASTVRAMYGLFDTLLNTSAMNEPNAMTVGQSYSEWLGNSEPEYKTCPECEGWGHIPKKCSCGNIPDIDAEECETCGKPCHMERCPLCNGKKEVEV